MFRLYFFLHPDRINKNIFNNFPCGFQGNKRMKSISKPKTTVFRLFRRQLTLDVDLHFAG